MLANRLDPFFAPFALFDRLAEEFARPTPAGPPTNLYVGEDDATAVFELPGVELEDVVVDLEDGRLSVEATRSRPELTDGDQPVVQERGEWTVRRSVKLPFDADREAITARYERGLLTVRVPKSEAAKPARIPVTAG